MHYAIKYPENLNSMLLIGSVAPTSEMMQSASLLDASNVSPEDSIEFNEILTSEAMANGEAEAIEKLMKLSFKRQFFNRNFADSLNLSISERFMTTSGLLRGLQMDLIDFDLTDELALVTVPTLIIYGDNEATYKVSDEILYKTMPNAQNWVLRDCGHFPFIEKKDDFGRIVINFMAGLDN
jgi:proline iminopeptidase